MANITRRKITNKNKNKTKNKTKNKYHKKQKTKQNLKKRIKGGVLNTTGTIFAKGSFKSAYKITSRPLFTEDEDSILRKIEENPDDYVYMEENHPGDIDQTEIKTHKLFSNHEIQIAPSIYENIPIEKQHKTTEDVSTGKRTHDGDIKPKNSYIIEYCVDINTLSINNPPNFNDNFLGICEHIMFIIERLCILQYVYWDIKPENICVTNQQVLFFIDFDNKFCYSIADIISQYDEKTQNIIVNNMKQMMITMFIMIMLKLHSDALNNKNKKMLISKFKEYYGKNYNDPNNTKLHDFLDLLNGYEDILWKNNNWSPLPILYYYIDQPNFKINLNNQYKLTDSNIDELSDKIDSIIYELEQSMNKPM